MCVYQFRHLGIVKEDRDVLVSVVLAKGWGFVKWNETYDYGKYFVLSGAGRDHSHYPLIADSARGGQPLLHAGPLGQHIQRRLQPLPVLYEIKPYGE